MSSCRQASDSRLVAFLYLLIRDEITTGRLEKLLQQIDQDDSDGFEISVQALAEYCREAEVRLLRPLAGGRAPPPPPTIQDDDLGYIRGGGGEIMGGKGS